MHQVQPKTRFYYTAEIGECAFELNLYKSFGKNDYNVDYAVDYNGQWLGTVKCRGEHVWQAELTRTSEDSPIVHQAPGHFKSLEEGIQWIIEMYGASYLMKQKALKQEQDVKSKSINKNVTKQYVLTRIFKLESEIEHLKKQIKQGNGILC